MNVVGEGELTYDVYDDEPFPVGKSLIFLQERLPPQNHATHVTNKFPAPDASFWPTLCHAKD